MVIPDFVERWASLRGFISYKTSSEFFFTNSYFEIRIYKTIHNAIMVRCDNLEVTNFMLFTIQLPEKEKDFLTLMKILLNI